MGSKQRRSLGQGGCREGAQEGAHPWETAGEPVRSRCPRPSCYPHAWQMMLPEPPTPALCPSHPQKKPPPEAKEGPRASLKLWQGLPAHVVASSPRWHSQWWGGGGAASWFAGGPDPSPRGCEAEAEGRAEVQ